MHGLDLSGSQCRNNLLAAVLSLGYIVHSVGLSRLTYFSSCFGQSKEMGFFLALRQLGKHE